MPYLTHPTPMPSQAVGASVGFAVAAGMMALRNPARAGAFRDVVLDVVPFTAGIGAAYTLGAGVTEELRGARDWRSSFVGGAMAGAFSLGLKRRSPYAAFTGALGMGVAAACGDWMSAMEPQVGAAYDARLLDTAAIASSSPAQDARTSSASRELVARLA